MTCTHHWLLDTPSGPWTSGRCKLCGEIREFPSWETDPTAIALSAKPVKRRWDMKPCPKCGKVHLNRRSVMACSKASA